MPKQIMFDGTLHEFPDDFTDTDISEALSTHSPAGIQAAAVATEKPSLARKFAMGAGDVVQGVSQALAHYGPMAPSYLPASAIPNQPSAEDRSAGAQMLDQDIAKRESDWQARRKASGDTGVEWMRGAGAAVASAPALAAMPQIGAGGIWGALANGAVQGGFAGLTTPTTDTSKGYGQQKLDQIMAGAAFGAGTNAAVGGLARMVSPKVDPALQYLRDRNIDPTVGQNFGPGMAAAEDRFSSVNPFVTMGQKGAVKQFNVAALNEALVPLSEATGQKVQYTGPAGRDGIKAVGDMLSEKFNTLKSSVTLPVDDTIKSSLNQVEQKLAVEAPPMASRLKTFLDNRLYNRVDGDGVLTGDAFKSVESALTEQAGRYSKSLDGDQRAYAEALHDAADALREHLAISNPDKAAELGALNKGWAVLARIEDAVPTGSHEGLFTPYSLARATETADKSVRHRAYVRGEAMLQPLTDAGLKYLGGKYPDSGSVGRAVAGTAVLGGTAAINPAVAAGLASSGLAYTGAGRALIGAVLNDRPAFAAPVASGIRKAAPLLATGATYGFLQ